MKKANTLLMILATTLGFSMGAGAVERYVLDMTNSRTGQDLHLRGNNTLALKQEIRNIYGRRLNLRRQQLLRVKVVGKSKRGNGSVELFVGHQPQGRQRLYGTPRGFRNPGNYDRVRLQNYGSSRGAWQLELNGNIKIKKIVVVTDGRRGGPGGGRLHYINVGEIRSPKFVTVTNDFYPSQNRVQEVVIEGTKGKTNVQSVLVTYGNGTVDFLSDLTGMIRDGRVKKAYIGGRNVRKIEIQSTSALSGSRGKIQVSLGVR